MTRIHSLGLWAIVVCLWPGVTTAQTMSPAPPDVAVTAMNAIGALDVSSRLMIAGSTAAASAQAGEENRGFLRDVASDYRNFFSWENAQWLAVGGVAALAVHGADEAIRSATEDPEATLTQALELNGGAQYGNLVGQMPLAVGWWTISYAMGSGRGAAAGRDLVRAQISALSWTYVLKYAVDRTRPNGDPRSFPSGHASAAFATATVLQSHYGWKLGLPMFAAAGYTAVSRVTENKHWASDVMFGAVVGMTSGRTVTVRLRRTRLAVTPRVVPGGGAIMLTAF
jgi:membrane-associated phospholipid phosphatase